MNEIWKSVIDYEDYYEVSNLGRVRSKDRVVYNNGGKQFKKGKILKGGLCGRNRNYRFVTLSKNGATKNKYIHRLVAEAFIENTHNKPTVDHIDRNTINNSVDNLRWATNEEQTMNADTTNKQNRKQIQIVFKNKVYKFNSQIDCANYFNIHKGRVYELASGKRKEYKGIKILANC